MIKLTKDLLTIEPENIARNEMDISRRNKRASSTQIRKFYDDFLLLHTKAHRDSNNEKIFQDEILPLIYFSKAKLAYSLGRNIIHTNFRDEIVAKVDKIETIKDFDNFILFYQALIGYTKFYENENSSYSNKKYTSNSRHRNNYNNSFYKK